MDGKISVIIPTKGREEKLHAVLASLHQQTYPVHELILVDDSSAEGQEGNKQVLDKFTSLKKPSFSMIYVPGRQVGAADARNQGAELASGDIMSFIDDDVVLENEYYQNVMSSFSGRNVAGVTGVVTNYQLPSRNWMLLSKLFFLSTVSLSKGCMRRSAYPCYLLDSNEPKLVGVMSGCNMSIRREIFLEHLFDARLAGYSYLEDADLSFRISKKHRLLFDPDCRLVHNTTDKGVDERYYKIKMSYHRYIYEKNFAGNPLNALPFGLSILADLLLVTERSFRERNKKLITAALEGLLKRSKP